MISLADSAEPEIQFHGVAALPLHPLCVTVPLCLIPPLTSAFHVVEVVAYCLKLFAQLMLGFGAAVLLKHLLGAAALHLLGAVALLIFLLGAAALQIHSLGASLLLSIENDLFLSPALTAVLFLLLGSTAAPQLLFPVDIVASLPPYPTVALHLPSSFGTAAL